MDGPLHVSIVSSNAIRRAGLRQILEERNFIVDNTLSSHIDLGTSDDHAILLVIVGAETDEASFEACCYIHAKLPDARIIILGHDTSIQHVANAFRAGTDGFVSHDVSCASLAEMLKLIALGEKLVPSRIVSDLEDMVDDIGGRAADARQGDANLSPRELATLRGLIRGEPNKIIARQLDISEATVKVHVKSILRKLHVLNRTQAAIWGVQHEPVEPGVADAFRECLAPVSARLALLGDAQLHVA